MRCSCCGVGVGVQEADRDCADTGRRRSALGHAARAVASSGVQHVALEVHALSDLEGEAARHEAGRLVVRDVVHHRAVGAAELVHVAEPLGRDQRRRRAGARQQRVEGERVPWTNTRATPSGSAPALRNVSSTPTAASAGVVGTLSKWTLRAVSSSTAASVNVPPTSIATRSAPVRIARRSRMSGAHRRRTECVR